jgi:hypothetical protein
VSTFPRRGGLVAIHRPTLFRVIGALLDRQEGSTVAAMRFLAEVDGLAVPRTRPVDPFARQPGVDLSEPSREPDVDGRAERTVEPRAESALQGFARRLAERRKLGQL